MTEQELQEIGDRADSKEWYNVIWAREDIRRLLDEVERLTMIASGHVYANQLYEENERLRKAYQFLIEDYHCEGECADETCKAYRAKRILERD